MFGMSSFQLLPPDDDTENEESCPLQSHYGPSKFPPLPPDDKVCPRHSQRGAPSCPPLPPDEDDEGPPPLASFSDESNTDMYTDSDDECDAKK